MRISDWSSDVCSSDLNKRGYAFVGGPTGVQVVDVITKDEKLIEGEGAQLEEKVLFTIPTAGTVRDIVTRSDLGAAYVATDAGVMIIDTFMLQQFDADFTTPQVVIIGTGRAVAVGEGDGASGEYRNNPVTAIAIDPAGRYL